MRTVSTIALYRDGNNLARNSLSSKIALNSFSQLIVASNCFLKSGSSFLAAWNSFRAASLLPLMYSRKPRLVRPSACCGAYSAALRPAISASASFRQRAAYLLHHHRDS
jgi:hypothetical protein